jgi:hypothetical protein
MPGCELLPFDTDAGHCRACGKELTKAQRSWCGGRCQMMYEANHYWAAARHAAMKRDRGCVKCGWVDDKDCATSCGQYFFWSRAVLDGPDNRLEVNHIVPRRGEGYGTGCHHHQSNLEVLCKKHHLEVTRQQRVAARTQCA